MAYVHVRGCLLGFSKFNCFSSQPLLRFLSLVSIQTLNSHGLFYELFELLFMKEVVVDRLYNCWSRKMSALCTEVCLCVVSFKAVLLADSLSSPLNTPMATVKLLHPPCALPLKLADLSPLAPTSSAKQCSCSCPHSDLDHWSLYLFSSFIFELCNFPDQVLLMTAQYFFSRTESTEMFRVVYDQVFWLLPLSM